MFRRALGPAVALLTVACGGASADAPPPNAAAPAGKAKAQPAKESFVTFEDKDLGYQVDFFGKPDRGETKTRTGPDATVKAYSVSATGQDHAQLLNVQAVNFAGGKAPEEHGCRPMLPAFFKEMAADRAECGPVRNVKLLEHDPKGVYSITGEASGCTGIPESKAVVHVACDERVAGKMTVYSMIGLSSDPIDPMNRWFLCSLKLAGNVITCPWGASGPPRGGAAAGER